MYRFLFILIISIAQISWAQNCRDCGLNEKECKCYQEYLQILLSELDEQSPGIYQIIESLIPITYLEYEMAKRLIVVFTDQATRLYLIRAYNTGFIEIVINNIISYLKYMGMTPFEGNLWLMREKENLPPL